MIMLSLLSFPMKLIKVFAQFKWHNRSAQTALEENCNSSNNKYVNEYILVQKGNLHVYVKQWSRGNIG
jgi:hypothetical protein